MDKNTPDKIFVPEDFTPEGIALPKEAKERLDKAVEQQVAEINKHTDSFMRKCFSLMLPEEIIAIFDSAKSTQDLNRNAQLVAMLGLRANEYQALQLEKGVLRQMEIIRIPRSKRERLFVVGRLKISREPDNENKVRLESEINRNCESVAYTLWTPVIRQWLRKLAGTGHILANSALAKRPGFRVSDGEIPEQNSESGEQQREETDRGSGEGTRPVSVPQNSVGTGDTSKNPEGTCDDSV